MDHSWLDVMENFKTDDGSLPSVVFSGLNPESLRKITGFIFQNGIISTPGATLHDAIKGSDILIEDIEDPAEQLISSSSSFHCCFDRIQIGDTSLPTLGIFFFPDLIEIDYRMGTEWNPRNVEAFFRLLHELKKIAPEGQFQLGSIPPPPFPDSFNEALKFISGERSEA